MLNPKIGRCLVTLALGCILAGACVPPLSAANVRASSPAHLTIRAVAPLADGWWDEIYGPIENALSRRETMVQFGAVGVLIGLFIIWYRRT
jgi:hypothetical protein